MSSLSRRSLLGGLLGLVAAPAAPAAASPFWQFFDGNVSWQLRTPRPELVAPPVLVWSGPSYAAAHAFMQEYRLRLGASSDEDVVAMADARGRESRAEAESALQDTAYAWLDGEQDT